MCIRDRCDADNNYIVVICLLFGCFVQLLRQSKGAMAVADMARRYVKSEKQVLLMTWICGVIIFIDDYLSILVTANCVLDLSDEYKTPREMLCYIINTTSAPVCLIIPISAWVVFFSGVFEQQPEAAVVGDSAMDLSLIHILAAVNHRRNTGQGQYIDVAMMDGCVPFNSIDGASFLVSGKQPEREGERLNGGCVYDYYETKDGQYMSVGSLEPQFWERFCMAIGREDLIEGTVWPENVHELSLIHI